MKLMTSLPQLAQNLEKFSLAELENMKPLDVATSRTRDEAIRFIELKNAGFPGARTRTTDLSSAGLPHPQHPAWEAIKSLFSRPWFKRMWIIQEVVLSQDVVVILGRYLISWKLVLETAQAYLKLDLLRVTRPQDNTTFWKDFEQCTAIFFGTLTFNGDFQCRSLIKLLSSSQHYYCSDPRDKVYALLGLANDQGLHQMVSVDYAKSVEAVYLECAKFLIRNGDGMEMLLHAGIPQKRKDTDLKLSLPSWVPDWSASGPRYAGYQAAGETQIDIKLEDGGNGLNAKGIRIDVIDSLAPLLGANDNDIRIWEQKVRKVAQQSRFFS